MDIEEQKAAIQRALENARENGYSFSAIDRQLGVPRTTVAGFLHKGYIGTNRLRLLAEWVYEKQYLDERFVPPQALVAKEDGVAYMNDDPIVLFAEECRQLLRMLESPHLSKSTKAHKFLKEIDFLYQNLRPEIEEFIKKQTKK